jgi:predicted lysophospholipase L1 biosynthesis ABC-type transport system permease subunit
MENEKYLNDISEIKNLMNKSSRFISLSGLSGILAGVYALVGAWMAYETIYTDYNYNLDNYDTNEMIYRLILIASIVLISV